MRSKNAIKSLLTFFVYEFFVFIASIIYPRWIILAYGSEINGLSSTIIRVLSLINLIQAGAVGAAIFQMYKPVADNDYKTQSEILYSSKKFYGMFTIVYVFLSSIVGGFYSIYLGHSVLTSKKIFLAFMIMTLNGAVQLYVTSLCDIFFAPHQKKYFITISQIICQIVNYGLLTFVLYFNFSFINIYVAMLTGGIVGSSLNIYFYRKYTKGKICEEPENRHYKIPDRKYLMLACIGSEVITAAPTVIITTFIGLLHSSVFSVYSLVFLSMKTLLSTIQLSVSPIFGNLTKTSENEKLFYIYDLVELITIMFGTMLSVCTAALIIPFIKLYTAGIKDVNYMYPLLAVFVVIFICLFTAQTSFGYVSTVYGLFKQTCNITLSSSLIGIVVSVICTVLWGMPYVMIGLIINQILSLFVTMHVLKKNIIWYKSKGLFRRCTFMIINTGGTLVIFFKSKWSINSWSSWFLNVIIMAFLIMIIISVYCLLFERKQMKSICVYMKQFL